MVNKGKFPILTFALILGYMGAHAQFIDESSLKGSAQEKFFEVESIHYQAAVNYQKSLELNPQTQEQPRHLKNWEPNS